MKVYTTSIDKRGLLKELGHLFFSIENKDVVLNDIAEKVNKSNGLIDSFLKEIDSIEDNKIRKSCRIVALAQKFNAKLDYSSGYPYVDYSAYIDDIYFLDFRMTTAVVSKYGEVLIDEGSVWINPSSNYGTGFPMKSVTDNKWGFINNSGSILLPCIFDYQHTEDTGELNFLYNNVNFELTSYGKLENLLDMVSLDSLIEWCDDSRHIVCMNSDSEVFILWQHDHLEFNWLYEEEDSSYEEEDNSEIDAAFKKVSAELTGIILRKADLEKYII